MDYREVDGQGLTTQGQVYKYGGLGDGGALHQTPGGPHTYVGNLGSLKGTSTGTHAGGYYQGHGDDGS